MITSFVDVFNDKLSKLKKHLKKELSKDKKSWDRPFIKSLLAEAKELKQIINNARKEPSRKTECPKCGHKFDT